MSRSRTMARRILEFVNLASASCGDAAMKGIRMPDIETTIRERAYHLWTEAGRPDGQADGFWLSAQRELLSQSMSQIATVKETAPKKPVKAKSSSPRKRKAAA
jgi:hypothetical protein